jgi:hypothetical protein
MNSVGHKRKQLHLWVPEDDYKFLIGLSEQQGESMATVVRRILRIMRAKNGTIPQPQSGPQTTPELSR